MGAVRSLRYSPCGRHLAVAEPADFVTIYSADDAYETAQEVCAPNAELTGSVESNWPILSVMQKH